jgi:uncharacterized protein GlcG (DUF336 family)
MPPPKRGAAGGGILRIHSPPNGAESRFANPRMSLPLDQANLIIDAALAERRRLGLGRLTVAVLDTGGHLIALKREDGSEFLRPSIAIGKAWGALGMGHASRVWPNDRRRCQFSSVPCLTCRMAK